MSVPLLMTRKTSVMPDTSASSRVASLMVGLPRTATVTVSGPMNAAAITEHRRILSTDFMWSILLVSPILTDQRQRSNVSTLNDGAARPPRYQGTSTTLPKPLRTAS